MTYTISIRECNRKRLPNRRPNVSFTFEFEGHGYRATAGWFPSGGLAEVFLDTSKAGTPLQHNAETAAILASIALQHGVEPQTLLHSVHGPIAIAIDHFTKVEVL